VVTPPHARPLRADAQRNHERIIAAAYATFAEAGLDAPIEEVARRAGVGPATVYRRFPNKQALVRAIVEARLAELEPLIAGAVRDEDPWRGLLTAIEAVLDIQARNMAFLRVLAEAGALPHLKGELGERVFAPLYDLFARAQAAGRIRADLEPTEIHVLIRMVAATGDDARGIRRYLALLADALQTPAPTPLPSR